MPGEIDAIRESCYYLMALIENSADCEEIGRAQLAFRRAVDQAMKAYKRGEIAVDIRTMPTVMHDFVMNDMPDPCSADRETLARFLTKIRLFLNTMDLLVRPSDVAESEARAVAKSSQWLPGLPKEGGWRLGEGSLASV
ncbi:MAG: hypothetical protein ACTSVD_00205 [Candidatus Thorarchaeota archaeon]|nr:MAG: hypothetical protein DRO73_06890 [Candidatus Thorarchaeota archaeon]